MLEGKKEEIIALVRKDELGKALDQLLAVAEAFGDGSLKKEVDFQKGKLRQFELEQLRGTTKKETLDLQRNQLRFSILSLTEYLNDYDPTGTTTKPPSSGSTSLLDNKKLLFIFGTICLLLVFFTVLFLPCPTELQYSTFRTILSIGVAGIAAIIPGFFELKYKKIISGGGALGVFALVYLMNPAIANSFNNCGSLNFSIVLKPQTRSWEYNPKQVGVVKLQLGAGLEQSEIDREGIADFKNIPSEYKNEEVTAELNLSGWQFVQTDSNRISFALDESYINLEIEPDGSLSELYGQVRDENDRFVEAAMVQIKGGQVSGVTDANGRFKLAIPNEYQEEEQTLTISKEGYALWSRKVYPGLKKEIPVLLKQH